MAYEECEVKKLRKGNVAYFKDGVMVARSCGTCGETKPSEEFYVASRKFGGRESNCIECKEKVRNEYRKRNRERILEAQKEYRKRNRERIIEYDKEYRKRNRERCYEYAKEWRRRNRELWSEHTKEWRKRNPESARLIVQRRLARKRALPDTLTKDDVTELLAHFGGGCALTGSADYHLDHVIPLSTGHGGTIRGNMIPLRADLNVKKNSKNIFEWFNECKKREGLSQERFDALIEYLAELNEMTPQEYRDYVYECHAEEATTWMDTEKQFNTTQTTS